MRSVRMETKDGFVYRVTKRELSEFWEKIGPVPVVVPMEVEEPLQVAIPSPIKKKVIRKPAK